MNKSINNRLEKGSIFHDNIALLILVIGFLVRGIAGTLVPPGIDEAYYGVCSFHLDWGFFDHPPIVAITAGIGHWLSGSYSPFSLRVGALVIFLFSAILIYQISLDIFNRGAARIALIFVHIIPYFLIGMGAFVIPDNALGLFWLLFMFSLLKIRKTGAKRWFLLFGFSLGFALLSKYHGILLLVAFGWCVLFYREWRFLLKNPYLYLGILISIILFLPNVYWNYKHEWVSYIYQFGKGISKFIISPTLFFQGIGVQLGYLLPWNMYVLVVAIVLNFKKNISATRWLLPFAVIPIAAFTLVGATRQILPHWPMPGYIAGIILSSGWMAHWKLSYLKRFLWISGIFTLLIVFIITMQATIGFIPLGTNIDLTLAGQGWREVVDSLETQDYFENDNTFLFTHKYYTGGELAYGAQNRVLTAVFNYKAANMFAFWIDMKELIGKDGIFIMQERFPADPKKLYRDYFEEFIPLDDITTTRAGKPAQTFKLWLCKKLKKSYPLEYGNE
ncbi:MAG: glycosyltransferase family 39 protein [Candidatus Cloacimonetes bacterium]|nr:glycosyltransferase family 39 protein [Candidatus Cloacimonadota bacterium]